MPNLYLKANTFLFLIVGLISSCTKPEITNIKNAGDKLIGTWNVDQINTRILDTMGNLILESNLTNQGTITFARGDKNAQAAAYFDHADFKGACSYSDMINYFRLKAAGDGNGDFWSVDWDADPEDLRVQFWAESAGGSYHISTNHSYSGNTQSIYYVVPPSLYYPNKRYFYNWKLSKQ